MRSKAAREARLAEAASVEYKTILNGLAMCVSSNSKRDRRSAGPGPCSRSRPGQRSTARSHSTARSQTHDSPPDANAIQRPYAAEGLLLPTTVPGPIERTSWSIPNVSRFSHAVSWLAVVVLGLVDRQGRPIGTAGTAAGAVARLDEDLRRNHPGDRSQV